MKKSKAIIASIAVLMLLSSCGAGQRPASDSSDTVSLETEEQATITTFVTSLTSSATTQPVTETSKTYPKYLQDSDNPDLPVYAFLNPAGFYTITHGGIITNGLDERLLFVSEEFRELVTEDEWGKWAEKHHVFFDKTDEEVEQLSYQINDNLFYEAGYDINCKAQELSEIENIYSFVQDFNLSEKQIRDGVIKTNENAIPGSGVMYEENYNFTEKQIAALCKKNNEAEVIELFSDSRVIIKGDLCFPLGWFLYASVDDYKKYQMTFDDIIKVLESFEALKPLIQQHTLDLIQYKAYKLLDGNVDVIKLCGYDRDFSMPMAYEYYLSNRYYAYQYFNQTEICGEDMELNEPYYIDNILCIQKSGVLYTPHWVYYNTPTAYKEAGITATELKVMLPKYKELGILSEQAYTALEDKINSYS